MYLTLIMSVIMSGLISSCSGSYILLKQYQTLQQLYGINGDDMNGDVNTCQPVTIQACKSLGYNKTLLTDSVYLLNMRKSEITPFIELFRNEPYYQQLLFYVCMMFNPICFKNYKTQVLPCRSVCENVKKQCYSKLKKYQIDWPTQFDCSNLHDHDSNVCIKPNSIVSRKCKYYLYV